MTDLYPQSRPGPGRLMPAGMRGFTIVELMMVLIVAAVILVLAVPSYQGTIRRNAIMTETNRLRATLEYARSQAVSLGQVVTVRAISASANDWSQGWTVYADVGGEGNQDGIDGVDLLLRTMNAGSPQADLVSNDGTVSDNDRYVSFNPNGTLRRGGGDISFDVCDGPRSETGRRIAISSAGRINVAEVAAGSCG